MPPPQRLVRRAPLVSRIKAYLDPVDFLIWLSEELNSNSLEDTFKQWAAPIGLALNVIFMIARANVQETEPGYDVFADAYERQGSGWLAWFSSFIVHLLSIVSLSNAFYTFWRTRHYRLFENNINVEPNTPSAHRVRVDSSPISSSPLRYLSDYLTTSSAQARSHPDASRDVWEVRVWDPTPICLRIFCLFSPGHVLVYWLFLPLEALDPRPSVTVTKTIVLNLLLTAQLTILQSSFSQQAKDSTLIHKEVQNEYDTKFVHPATHRHMRDAGIQLPTKATDKEHKRTGKAVPEVLVATPKTYVNRGFNPRPNPSYAPHYNPDGVRSTPFAPREPLQRAATTPNVRTPAVSTAGDFSSPLKPTPGMTNRQSSARPTAPEGGGGYLGVHSHAQSPLKKQAILNSDHTRYSTGANETRQRLPTPRDPSPLKRSSMPGLREHGGFVSTRRLDRMGGNSGKRNSDR